jgi:hypothetical protein
MARTRQRVVVLISLVVLLALVAVWYCLASRGTGPAAAKADGFTDAVVPTQDVPAVGAPIGTATLDPVDSLAAALDVKVPPPITWTMADGPPDDLPLADDPVDVFPGEVGTIARLNAAGDLGGVAVVGDTAYVATSDMILAVDVSSGKTSIVAGLAGETGCEVSLDPDLTRLQGPPGDVIAAGDVLYVADGCGIVTVALPTGATGTLASFSGPMTLGPDSHLYVGASYDGDPVIARVNPTGAVERYLTLPAGAAILGLAADAEYLWATVDESPSTPTVIYRITFSDGSVARGAVEGVDVAGAGQLVSAGPYLYAPSVGNTGVLRFTKRLGDWGLVVGGGQGDEDGVWASATFGSVRGLASDGVSIWVTDSANASLRRVDFSPSAAMSLGA